MKRELEGEGEGEEAAKRAATEEAPATEAPLAEAPPAEAPVVVDASLLTKSDASTTAAIIEAFKDNAKFATLSTAEMTGILARDREDGEKLASGVKLAVDKGVLAQNPPVEPTIKINVLGKTPNQVSREIIAKLPSSGCVMILQGLSGTGKGTTVECLKKQLPSAITWSNGNVFRSITLLALTACEQKGVPFDEAALTPALLKQCVDCLTFDKFGGKFDTRIRGFGLDMLVSEVENTTLRTPQIGKNIPTVAKMTQGEVVLFAGGAADKMRDAGCNVLVEGLMGATQKALKDVSAPTPAEIHAKLGKALDKMV